jgi:hypothetical protein
LSGVHLIGLTLVVGGSLVSGLRLFGVVLPLQPVGDVAGSARTGMHVGLAISIVSGLLMVASKTNNPLDSRAFQAKMLLLAAALICHFTISRGAIFGNGQKRRLAGGLELVLWLGVALAGCAFILLE